MNGKLPIPDFPDYEVTREGKVFRVVASVKGHKKGREVRSHVAHAKGYVKIWLCNNGNKRPIWLHRLVCRTFHGEPPVYRDKEAVVRHLDGDPANNHADNLRWGTQKENEEDKKRYGRFA